MPLPTGTRIALSRFLALALVGLIAAPSNSHAQTTYDLSNFPFAYRNSTDVVATLTTSTVGTFTTEAEIESFLNSAAWSAVLLNGGDTVLDLTSANSSWDLEMYGDSSATLTVTETEITLQYVTPNVDMSSARLVLTDPDTGFRMEFQQRNDYASGNYVELYALGPGAESIYNYGSPFVFPAPSHAGAPLTFAQEYGGVTTDVGQIQYSGNPTGWTSNRAETAELFPYFGYLDDYEIRFSIDSNPADSLWVVGLRDHDLTRWQSMNQAIRNDNGRMMVFESGIWRITGPDLSQGDVVSIRVTGAIIEYLHNDDVVFTSSSFVSIWSFATASFKNGAATLGASIRAASTPTPPPPTGTVPISNWENLTGSVSLTDNTLFFPGTSSTAWINSANSVQFTSLGVGNEYEVSWTVDEDPTSGIWVVGLGVNETRSNWRDVDYAFRNSNGYLTIHESGNYIMDVAALQVGDVVSIAVSGANLTFKLNGLEMYYRYIEALPAFYIDTAFKSGPSTLSFWLTLDGEPPMPPPSTGMPMTQWINLTGGVSAASNNITYSGEQTNWSGSASTPQIGVLGAQDNYTMSWTVDSDPLDSLWVVGFADAFDGRRWQDIDVGLRNANGTVHVYIGAKYVTTLGQIAEGDQLSISVASDTASGDCFEFRIPAYAYSTCRDSAEFFVDRFFTRLSFKYGAEELSDFLLTQD